MVDYEFKKIQGKKIPMTEDGDIVCLKCMSNFTPRVELPLYCPRCKAPRYWKPRKYKKRVNDDE